MTLEHPNSTASELIYAIYLRVPWHQHEADGSFSHRSNGIVKDQVYHIVEVLVEIARIDMRTFSCWDSALGPSFVLSPTCYSPRLIFVLWSIRGQIILRDLIWSFIGIMLIVGVLIMLVDDGHVDMVFWGVTVKVRSIVGK